MTLTRRQLLEGFGATVVVAGCHSSAGTKPSISALPERPEPVPGALVEERSIAELAADMAAGRATARDLTAAYLARIEAMNRRGPALRAVIEANPDALSAADELDRERAAGKLRGPMHGIPVLLKDNLATADRTETTAGSLALVGAKPATDSHVAARLRTAGAIILGKANLSEWANFRSTRSVSGWSARGGLCRNPYVLNRNACGSSSGSAVAAAASLCAAAVGTETNGSIVCPASANGVVGIKPTVGAVSRSGIIPISVTQDTAGPLARTVADAATLLTAMLGEDATDPATVGAPALDLAVALDPDGARGARIGVARNHFGFDPRVDALMTAAIAAFEALGAVIVDPVDTPTWDAVRSAEMIVLRAEFKHGIHAYLAGLTGDGPKTLADLIAFNRRHADQELAYFGQEIFIACQEAPGVDDPAYRTALTSLLEATRGGLDKTMDQHNLDAIVAPTGGPAWTSDVVNGDHFGGSSSTPAAAAGYPNVSVPAGVVAGLPVGLSLFGRRFSEPALVRIAYAYEQSTKHRRAPQYRQPVEQSAGRAAARTCGSSTHT